MTKPVRRNERVPLQKNGCYILAVICNVSKWPTIIPLKDLKAETVAEKLLELFSFSGLP